MKSHLLQLSKGTAIYGLGSMLQRFIGLLLLPLFTAYLSPEEYGVFSLLAILAMVGQPIFSLGMNAAMGPSYFQGNNQKQKLITVWTTFAILLVSSSILLVCAWAIPEVILRLVLLPNQYVLLASLTLTGCAFSVLSTPFMQRVQFEQQAVKFVFITSATTLLTIGINIWTVVFLHWGVKGLVISQLISHLSNLVLFLVLSIKESVSKIEVNLKIGKELLRLGLPLIPSFAFLFVLMNSNKYILQMLEGSEKVGIYSVGFTIGSFLSLLVSAISTSWYPFFMSFVERKKEASVIFGKVFSYYVISFGLVCLATFSMAKPIIVFITESRFHEAWLIVGFTSLAHFFSGIFSLSLPSVYFSKKVYYVSFVQGCSAIFSVVFGYFMIDFFGIIGSAITLAASHFLMAAGLITLNILDSKLLFKIQYEWLRIKQYSIFSAVYIAFSFWGGVTFSGFSALIYSILLCVISVIVSVLFLYPRERSYAYKVCLKLFRLK